LIFNAGKNSLRLAFYLRLLTFSFTAWNDCPDSVLSIPNHRRNWFLVAGQPIEISGRRFPINNAMLCRQRH
jgi:hypothetical protein